MRKICTYIACILAAMAMAACDGSVYYDESRSVDEHGWAPQDSVCFDVEVDDTTHLFNFFVEVRNSVTYPYSNTFLFINTTFPDGSVAHDTLECPLADPEGRWLGKRIGRYVDARYRLQRTLPDDGALPFRRSQRHARQRHQRPEGHRAARGIQ